MTQRLPQAAIAVPVCIEKDEIGFFGYSPVLEGIQVGGMTRDEVWGNLQVAVRLHIASYMKHSDNLPAGCVRGCGIPISDALSSTRQQAKLAGTEPSAAEVECEERELVVSL